jgi:hypothetical protein
MNWLRLKYSSLLLTAVSIILSSCAGITRHPESGYYEGRQKSQAEQFYHEKALSETSQASNQLGLNRKAEKDRSDYEMLASRIQLNRLEKALKSEREKQQYYNVKPYLASDEERIYFLSLKSFEQKNRFIQNLPSMSAAESNSPELQEAVDTGDIVLGMTKKSVKESWGEPESVEVAGNPVYGNERWRYTRNIASENGGNKEFRLIYFEGGRVAGWEKH